MAEKATKKTPVKKAPQKKVASKQPKKPVEKKAVSSDFSVIETGGKQYVVSAGDVLLVELLGDYNEGDAVVFDKVLMSDDGKNATLGTPYIKGAAVKATYLGLKKGKKLSIVRYQAKSNRDRKIGHRQKYAQVRIESI